MNELVLMILMAGALWAITSMARRGETWVALVLLVLFLSVIAQIGVDGQSIIEHLMIGGAR